MACKERSDEKESTFASKWGIDLSKMEITEDKETFESPKAEKSKNLAPKNGIKYTFNPDLKLRKNETFSIYE